MFPWDGATTVPSKRSRSAVTEHVLFWNMLYLAAECRDDTSLPMREIVVFLKDAPHDSDPEILASRKELEEMQGVRLFHFGKPDSLKTQLLEVCSGWVRSIVEEGGGARD